MKYHTQYFMKMSRIVIFNICLIINFLFLTNLNLLARQLNQDLSFSRGLSGSYLAGRIAGNNKDAVSAVQFFEHALYLDPNNFYLLQQVFYLNLINGDIDKALSFADRLIAINKNHNLAHTVKGIVALKNGNYGIAISSFNQADSKTPLQILTNQLLAAWAEVGTERLDDALTRVDQLKGPDWYESFRAYHGALLAEHLGATEQALERIKRAFDYDPSALRIVETYARLNARQNNQEKALAAISAFKQKLTNHPYMDAVESDIIANNHIKIINNVRHGAAEVLFGLGAALGQENGSDLSSIFLQLSLYLDPQSDLAITTLSSLYIKNKLYEEAIALIDQLPQSSPLFLPAEIDASLNLARISDINGAIKRLSKTARLSEDPMQANIALGNLLRFEKRFDEANEIYSMIIDGLKEIEPQHWSLFYYRGITFERTSRWQQAEADFKRALTLSPDHPLVLNYLGYSWVDQNVHLEEALKMIEKAIEQRPNEGFIIDSLGWAFYRLERYEEAVQELEKAVKAMPADPLVHDHLGDAYWKTDRTLEAQFQWRHARDLEPEKQELDKILEKIEHGLDKIEKPHTKVDTKRTHVVIEGETLWDIAQDYLGSGDAYVEILMINRDRLPQNGRLKPGTELRIPDDS